MKTISYLSMFSILQMLENEIFNFTVKLETVKFDVI